jgi:hypothetical protein
MALSVHILLRRMPLGSPGAEPRGSALFAQQLPLAGGEREVLGQLPRFQRASHDSSQRPAAIVPAGLAELLDRGK